MNAIIGYTGFVGSNLSNQKKFDLFFNSKNINNITNYNIDTAYVAAPSATKWIINKSPICDLKNIVNLSSLLLKSKIKRIVLISTIDVYKDKNFLHDESFVNHKNIGNSSYGQNRLFFEKIIKENSNCFNIIRVPGLFGPNLKKNIIYDLINNNMLEKISLNTEFQWLNIQNLNKYIEISINNNIKEINLFTEPIKTKDLVEHVFPEKINFCNGDSKNKYNIKTLHHNLFNSKVNGYIEESDSVLNQIKNYVNSEL